VSPTDVPLKLFAMNTTSAAVVVWIEMVASIALMRERTNASKRNLVATTAQAAKIA